MTWQSPILNGLVRMQGGLGSSIRTGSFLWSANWSEHLIESKGLEKILWLQGDRTARNDEVTFVCSGGGSGVREKQIKVRNSDWDEWTLGEALVP